jgi:hypothetical protein
MCIKKMKEKGSLLSFFFLSSFLYADITTHYFFRHPLAHCILATSMNVCGQQTKVICKYNRKKRKIERFCCLMKETEEEKKLRERKKNDLCVEFFCYRLNAHLYFGGSTIGLKNM